MKKTKKFDLNLEIASLSNPILRIKNTLNITRKNISEPIKIQKNKKYIFKTPKFAAKYDATNDDFIELDINEQNPDGNNTKNMRFIDSEDSDNDVSESDFDEKKIDKIINLDNMYNYNSNTSQQSAQTQRSVDEVMLSLNVFASYGFVSKTNLKSLNEQIEEHAATIHGYEYKINNNNHSMHPLPTLNRTRSISADGNNKKCSNQSNDDKTRKENKEKEKKDVSMNKRNTSVKFKKSLSDQTGNHQKKHQKVYFNLFRF